MPNGVISIGRSGGMESRVIRLEDRMSKVEDKLDRHSIEQAETRVYVKEIYKKLDDLKDSFEKTATTNGIDWAKIIERIVWGFVTVVGYFLGKGLGM